jgi:23S rRNA (cytosine1962-C5)-methyltransferase
MNRHKKQWDEVKTQPSASARLRLRISAAAETQLRARHPWVYADSVREQNRDGTAGELAVIYDRKDKFLAVGLFDPGSPIRVRVLHIGKPQEIDLAWWEKRLEEAVARRRDLFDNQTNGYRIINGESDGWPGLVLDRYDQTLVLKLYTSAWFCRFAEISRLLITQLKPERLILRLSRNTETDAHESISSQDGQILFGDRLEACPKFLESGLRFEADVCRGQKTGFFLDQRENRRAVESLARGRRVLNAFSFSGGFSLYAARGGAVSVTDLDISAHALASAKRNFKLNESDAAVASCRHELVQADAFDWLRSNESRQFDLIVLDPPSFAKREAERAGAIRAYERLASLGIQHLAPGGILVACSCSAHVTAEEFFDAVRRSASKSRKAFEKLQTTRHAPDHPATFKEAEYLKAIYLRFA